MAEPDRPADRLIGHLVDGRYRLKSIAGEGGIGKVYLAEDETRDGAHVAVKVLKRTHTEDDTVVRRFDREAAILERLDHKNLVHYYGHGSLGDDSGRLYIAMEFVPGIGLDELAPSGKSLDIASLFGVLIAVSTALGAAHDAGVVHRDMKPSNVLLVAPNDDNDKGGEPVRVVDFGIARASESKSTLTKTGMLFGTPAYMSPEQAMGETEIGPPTDIYAFGVMLFELMTGARPFHSDQALVLLMAHLNQEMPPIEQRPGLGAPSELEALTAECMAKDPRARPANGHVLAERLRAIAASAGIAPAAPNAVVAAVLGGESSPTHAGDIADPKTDDVAQNDVGTQVALASAVAAPALAASATPLRSDDESSDRKRLFMAAAAVVFALIALVVWGLAGSDDDELETSGSTVAEGAEHEPGAEAPDTARDSTTAETGPATPSPNDNPTDERASAPNPGAAGTPVVDSVAEPATPTPNEGDAGSPVNDETGSGGTFSDWQATAADQEAALGDNPSEGPSVVERAPEDDVAPSPVPSEPQADSDAEARRENTDESDGEEARKKAEEEREKAKKKAEKEREKAKKKGKKGGKGKSDKGDKDRRKEAEKALKEAEKLRKKAEKEAKKWQKKRGR